MGFSKFDRIIKGPISISSVGQTEIIAAPSLGHLEIDFLELLPSGGSNTIIVQSASNNLVTHSFDDSQGYLFENNTGRNELECNEKEAFNLDTSDASLVTGRFVARVVNEG